MEKLDWLRAWSGFTANINLERWSPVNPCSRLLLMLTKMSTDMTLLNWLPKRWNLLSTLNRHPILYEDSKQGEVLIEIYKCCIVIHIPNFSVSQEILLILMQCVHSNNCCNALFFLPIDLLPHHHAVWQDNVISFLSSFLDLTLAYVPNFSA